MWTYHVWGEPKSELMFGFTLVNHCVEVSSLSLYKYIGKRVKK
jgi:hypothetical protein